MQKMLRVLGDRRAAIQNGETQKGFTLIELLVVVIIIGILAAIAIPVFFNQRENAWRSQVESDVRNAALYYETLASENNGTYPTASGTEMASNDDFTISEGTILTVTSDASSFQIVGKHNSINGVPTIEYNSESGGLGVWSDRDTEEGENP